MLRKLRSIPSATQRFNQQNTSFQTSSCNVDVVPLILQKSSLPGNHLQISIDATFITSVEEIERLSCRRCCCWGIWAIFLGRFTGPLRATVPIVAGISQMKFWSFQISNVSSAFLWSAVLIALGALGTAAMGPLGAAFHAIFG